VNEAQIDHQQVEETLAYLDGVLISNWLRLTNLGGKRLTLKFGGCRSQHTTLNCNSMINHFNFKGISSGLLRSQ